MWWHISSEPFLCILGQWGFIFRQRRSPRSDKARMWPRLVPHWAACLGTDLKAAALGYPWVFSDEAGEGVLGVWGKALCPLQLIQGTFCPEVTLWPMFFRTTATGKPCPSSVTLFLLPSLSLDWAPLPKSSGNILMRISCQDSSCYAPPRSQGRHQPLHKAFAPLVGSLRVRQDQSTDGAPIPFLFKHPEGDC